MTQTLLMAEPPGRRQRASPSMSSISRPLLDRSQDTVERFVQGYLPASAVVADMKRARAPPQRATTAAAASTEDLHIQLTPTSATYLAQSQPPSPDYASMRPQMKRRSFTEPLPGDIPHELYLTPSRPAPARPRTAPGTPLDRIPSGSRVIHLEETSRPSLAVENGRFGARRGLSMNDLAISTTSTVTVLSKNGSPISASPSTPTHGRSRSLTASAKQLARKASGKLRSLTTRSSTAPPPMPTAEAQAAAWQLGSLDLTRSHSSSTESKGKWRAASSSEDERDREADASFGVAVSTLDELTPTHTAIDGLPRSPVSPVRRLSSPQMGRQRSTTKSSNGRPTTAEPTSSPGKSKSAHRSSSPTAFFNRRQSGNDRSLPLPSPTTPEPGFMQRALKRNKSGASLSTSASSPSLFSHLHHQPVPNLPSTPLISPFPIELYSASASATSGEHIPLPPIPLTPKAPSDWPPKRTSSTRKPPPSPPPPPATPSLSLSSSLSALSMLSSPPAPSSTDRGTSFDSTSTAPRLRFPSSFGFVGRPSEDYLAPPLPSKPGQTSSGLSSSPSSSSSHSSGTLMHISNGGAGASAPLANANAASLPKPMDEAKEAERARRFDELLARSEVVVRKTLTPKVAGTLPTLKPFVK